MSFNSNDLDFEVMVCEFLQKKRIAAKLLTEKENWAFSKIYIL